MGVPDNVELSESLESSHVGIILNVERTIRYITKYCFKHFKKTLNFFFFFFFFFF